VNGRVRGQALPLFREPRAGGTLEARIRGLIERRARLFELVGPYKRSGNLQRWRSEFIAREHAAFARDLRRDLLAWLPELRSAHSETVDALDAALSFEVWDGLRSERRLGPERARVALARLVTALLVIR